MFKFLIVLSVLSCDVWKDGVDWSWLQKWGWSSTQPYDVDSEDDKTSNAVASSGKVNIGSALHLFRLINTIQAGFYGEKKIDENELLGSALEGMANYTEDKYTRYMTPEEFDKIVTTRVDETYDGGLGLYVIKFKNSSHIIVPEIIKDTPAEKYGIKRGDKIIQIDGEDVAPFTIEECVEKMKGKNGTKVKLLISRKKVEDKDEMINLELERATINISRFVEHKMLEDNIGYISLSKFHTDVDKKVRKVFEELKQQGAKHIILDLRDNPGGFLPEAIGVASIFIDQSPIVVQASQTEKTVFDATGNADTTTPLTLLINGGSASGSEIVAAAIKEHDRGILIGERSYGKGSVQAVMPVDAASTKKGAFVMTISAFLSPKENAINKVGVEPDIYVGRDSSTMRAVLDQEANSLNRFEDYYLTILEKVDEEKEKQLKTAIKLIKLLNSNDVRALR